MSKMEIHAYNESYLPYAMGTLAAMMDCGINRCGISPVLFHHMFLTSGVAGQFEKGNPRYVTGMSGAEITDFITYRTMGKLFPENDGTYSLSPEYWAGWVLAYYQWKSGKSFSFLQSNGLDIEKVIAMYRPFHEADIEKFSDAADAILGSHIKQSASPVKRARERMGITQKELAVRSDVSLRMIRAYEQKQQPLSNASFSTVSSIASALCMEADDLMM